MPAVRCQRCGAAVSVQAKSDGVEIGDGDSFRELCKSLRRSNATDDQSLSPEDCPAMKKAITRAAFRVSRHRQVIRNEGRPFQRCVLVISSSSA
jgi:hypothetical protein